MQTSVFKSLAKRPPGTMLDIGARDCAIANRFAEIGYAVDAIDPAPKPDVDLVQGVTYRQMRIEALDSAQRYDLVVASMVAHLVSYDNSSFIDRLMELTKPDGRIYLTLFGDKDGWAGHPKVETISFDDALALFEAAGLDVAYRSIEWFDGETYAGDPKFWHILHFLLRNSSNDNQPAGLG